MSNPNFSRYEAGWQRLSASGILSLRLTTPSIAPKIVKAIRKRKNLDTAYRLRLADAGLRDHLRWSLDSSTNILIITLSTSALELSDKL